MARIHEAPKFQDETELVGRPPEGGSDLLILRAVSRTEVSRRRFLKSAAAIVGGIITAQSLAEFASAAEQYRYDGGFAELYRILSDDIMGNPTSNPFPDKSGTGDVEQLTEKGLAFWRKATNTPTFTNGAEHWAITSDNPGDPDNPARDKGLAYWTGPSIDPPGLEPGALPTGGAVETPPVESIEARYHDEPYYGSLETGLQLVRRHVEGTKYNNLEIRIVERNRQAAQELLDQVARKMQEDPVNNLPVILTITDPDDPVFDDEAAHILTAHIGITRDILFAQWYGKVTYLYKDGHPVAITSTVAYYPDVFTPANLADAQAASIPGWAGSLIINGEPTLGVIPPGTMSILDPEWRKLYNKAGFTLVAYPPSDPAKKIYLTPP